MWTGVLLVAVILQSTILPLLAVHGVWPDLLLLVVVSSSLLLGKEHGVGIGFFAGLIQDLASGNIFGLNILSKLATGYCFGLAERKVFKDHILLPVIMVAMATLFNGAIMLAVLFVLGYQVDILPAVRHKILPLLFYNMVFSIPIHQIVYRLSRIQKN
ncbi:MAG: rod shape-determining protein MreD [Veillonellales bacterium]